MRSPHSVLPSDGRWYTAAEYAAGLAVIETQISVVQRQMLVAHAVAPESTLSVRQLAAAGGYELPNVTYAQYGGLAHKVGTALGYTGKMKVWTYILANGWRSEDDTLLWELHPSLVEALHEIGWVSRDHSVDLYSDIGEIQKRSEVDSPTTSRKDLLDARVGQGVFRRRVVRFWGTCAVTGVSEPAALRASHIKPWKSATDYERLDASNGLLLVAHLDALFDVGLISFETSGKILLSPELAGEDARILGIRPTMKLRFTSSAHEAYLAFHRLRFRGRTSR